MGSRRCFRRIGPIISQRQPVSRLWGGVSGDVKTDWGRLFGREKAGGGRRNCTRMRGLYAGAARACCRRGRRPKDGRKRDGQVRPWAARPAWVLEQDAVSRRA